MSDFRIDLPPKFLKKAAELQINPDEITEQFIRGSGSGGQKINKTSNTVLLIFPRYHLQIKCQNHREREKNRVSAYKILITKVENIIKGKASEQAQKIFKLRKQKKRRSKKAQEKVLLIKKIKSGLKQLRKPVLY